MPTVRLIFPQQPDAQSGSDPNSGSAHDGDMLALPPPQVELILSAMERIQDSIRWRTQHERALAILSHREKWRAGVYSEIAFWDRFLRERGGEYQKDYLERFDPALPLQPELVNVVTLPEGSTLRILDVGAGPLTWVGRTSPTWKVEITAIDPLADAYDQLLAAHNLTPPVRSQNVAAEDLQRTFSTGVFDLVNARNCLDHALDPIDAIQQMIELVRPNGVIFLAHAINEAITNGYQGLHQWNFRLDGTDFVVEDAGSVTNMNVLLHDRASVSSVLLWDHWLQTTIRPH